MGIGSTMGPLHPNLALPSALVVGIPPSTSHVLSFLFTTSYVGSLYIAKLLLPQKAITPASANASSQPGLPPVLATDTDAQLPLSSRTRGPEVGSRDHPDTIRLRMKAVGLATLASLGGVWYVAKTTLGSSFSTAVCTPSVLLCAYTT
jgi:prenyl protein peptidase